MIRACKALSGLALILALGSCIAEGPGYERLNRTVEIEPGTGDTIITQYWRLGSHTTATFKRIPRGDTDRRGEPPAPLAPLD